MKPENDTEPVKFKTMPFVEVRWLDAAANNQWVSVHGDASIEVDECITRGWVMRQDEKQIILCSTVGIDKDGLVEEANTTIAIPIHMVESVTPFTAKPRRKVAKKKQVEETSDTERDARSKLHT